MRRTSHSMFISPLQKVLRQRQSQIYLTRYKKSQPKKWSPLLDLNQLLWKNRSLSQYPLDLWSSKRLNNLTNRSIKIKPQGLQLMWLSQNLKSSPQQSLQLTTSQQPIRNNNNRLTFINHLPNGNQEATRLRITLKLLNLLSNRSLIKGQVSQQTKSHKSNQLQQNNKLQSKSSNPNLKQTLFNLKNQLRHSQLSQLLLKQWSQLKRKTMLIMDKKLKKIQKSNPIPLKSQDKKNKKRNQ